MFCSCVVVLMYSIGCTLQYSLFVKEKRGSMVCCGMVLCGKLTVTSGNEMMLKCIHRSKRQYMEQRCQQYVETEAGQS